MHTMAQHTKTSDIHPCPELVPHARLRCSSYCDLPRLIRLLQFYYMAIHSAHYKGGGGAGTNHRSLVARQRARGTTMLHMFL